MAQLNSGAAPKDANRRARRNATFAMTKLPSEGRQGKPPAWPLLADIGLSTRLKVARETAARLRDEWACAEDGRTARALAKKLESAEVYASELEQQLKVSAKLELQLWAELWATPQAVQWEKLRWTRSVAQYVRWKVLAELGSLDASKEARQLEDRLGLSPLSMLRLRWEVVGDAVAAKREERAAARSKPTGSRARRGPLRAV